MNYEQMGAANKEFQFMLGERVFMKSGFAGTVVARTQWIQGYNTYAVRAGSVENGVPIPDQWIDEFELEPQED